MSDSIFDLDEGEKVIIYPDGSVKDRENFSDPVDPEEGSVESGYLEMREGGEETE